MGDKQKLRRIGILNRASHVWPAGATYTSTLAYSLTEACRGTGVQVYLFSPEDHVKYLPADLPVHLVRLPSPEYLPGELAVRRVIGKREKLKPLRGELRLRNKLGMTCDSDLFFAARKLEISVLLPLFDVHPWDTGLLTIGWISDLQHLYLPELFPASDRQSRDSSIRNLAARATLVMLSSRDSLEQFASFVPGYAHKGRVISFPSHFAFKPPGPEEYSVQSRYHLPEKFALVVNQFWSHKNHLLVVKAIHRLKEQGMRIPVVMTGLPSDYRDPSNSPISQVLQGIASSDLNEQIVVLGQVAYSDLVALIREAAIIIQPSRFEGWNTTVQDAKALGRPLLCSDIPVMREQALEALGFFPLDNEIALADLLAEHWPDLGSTPDYSQEAKALAVERKFARQHGRALFAICEEACSGS